MLKLGARKKAGEQRGRGASGASGAGGESGESLFTFTPPASPASPVLLVSLSPHPLPNPQYPVVPQALLTASCKLYTWRYVLIFPLAPVLLGIPILDFRD